MTKEFGLSVCVFAATGKPCYMSIDETFNSFEEALVAQKRFLDLFRAPDLVSVDIHPIYRRPQ